MQKLSDGLDKIKKFYSPVFLRIVGGLIFVFILWLVFFSRQIATAAYSQRLDSGSSSNYTDTIGQLWLADRPYTPGGFGNINGTSYSTTSPIAATNDDTLYQSNIHNTSFEYRFDVANGSYQLRLLFAEIFPPNFSVGSRVFNVTIEGTTVLSNYDIYAEVGSNTAVAKTFETTVADGQLNVVFNAVTGHAAVNAIEVIETVTGSPTPIPTSSPTPTPAPTSTPTPTPLPQPITYIQSNSSSGVSSSRQVAFVSGNSAGNLIVVSAGWGNSSVTASISDSAGNTYQSALGPITNGSIRSQIWYAENVRSGPNTVTVTYSSNVGSNVEIHEYAGIATANALDITSSQIGSGTTPSSGSAVVGQASELLFGFSNVSGSVSWTAGPSYTLRQTTTRGASEDRIISASGSYSASFTTSVSRSWVALLAAFRPPAGGPADTTPPGAVTNLTASGPTSNSITLAWTAPGDDGATGTATSYDVRYSTAIIDETNWGLATQASGEPFPSPAGTAQSMTVGNLNPATTYFFAIKTSDEAGNISAISNIATNTTLASAYNSTNIALHPTDMYSSIITDLDPRYPGNELYFTDNAGDVYQIRKEGSFWIETLLWDGPSAILTGITAGDFDPRFIGPEIALAGNNGEVTEVIFDGTSWQAFSIWNSGFGKEDIEAGDFDPTSAGSELVVAGNQATQGTWRIVWNGSSWSVNQIYSGGYVVAVGELNPNRAGLEIVVSSEGSTVLLEGSGTSWTPTTIATVGAGYPLNYIEIGDVDTAYPGNEVIVNRHITDQEGWIYEIFNNAGTWGNRIIWHEDGTNLTIHHTHGMIIGEFDSTHLGLEIVASETNQPHTEGRMLLVKGQGDVWSSEVIFRGPDEYHDLAYGDLDTSLAGSEVVGTGHASEVVMVYEAR